MTDLNKLTEAIVAGKLEVTQEIVNAALAEKVDPQVLINDYLTKGMEEIGQRFEVGKAFVPNLLMSARAMKGALEILKPLLKGDKKYYYRESGDRHGERRFARYREKPGGFDVRGMWF